MAYYDESMEASAIPDAPFKQHFVPRDVAHLHHVPNSALIPPADTGDADSCDHPQTPPEQKHSSPPFVTPNRRASYDTEQPTLMNRPLQRRSSLITPRVDVEDGALSVCPSCHLRRRSSVEAAELRSPKTIHIVLDMCGGEFCPDLSAAQAASPPIAHPHVRHSRLCEQQQSCQGRMSAQQPDVRDITTPPDDGIHYDQADRDVPSGEQESEKIGTEDESGCWSTGDFD
jgi:hypothetical protein